MSAMRVTELFDLKGKTAIVTGASSGLGVTFAEALAEAGADVEVAARRQDRLEEVATRLQKIGVSARPFRCDVSNEGEVISLLDDATDHFGKVDILINNAGVASIAPATDMPLEDWNRVLSVNLTGVFLTARTAAKKMAGKGGKIVNVASIYGAVGDVFPASPYYASKGAVINLTRDLAVEWAPLKINVNAIAPGFFPSEMTASIFSDAGSMEYLRDQTPLGRVGDPQDLKGAVVYLSSKASDYVTGQTIFVDGGWTAW